MSLQPKEKAKELVEKFSDLEDGEMYIGKAKQCALIAVDEIIELRKGYFDCSKEIQDEKYWQAVKQELEKLV